MNHCADSSLSSIGNLITRKLHDKIMLRIALAQINPTVGDLAGNQKKITDYIDQAKGYEADIVVFPELVICGYPPEDLLFKEYFVRDNLKAVRSLMRVAKNITAIIGFVDIDKNKNLYNAAAVLHNGELKAVCHKEQLPNYGVFDEKRYFHPGENEKIFLLRGVLFGVNICEDIWVDGGVYQRQVKWGARLIINMSSSPYDVEKLALRQELLRKRAVETKAHICYTNLVGGQDELVFDGGSLIVDPQGRMIASGKQFEEDLIITDLDIGLSSKKPVKADRKRIILEKGESKNKKASCKTHLSTAYNQIERIYQALILGTRDYIKKNGFQKAVIGLSGGIDSSLVAVVASEAVGKENVIGVSMPSRYTSEASRTDAGKLAENLGIQFLEIPIEQIFEAYLATLLNEFKGLESDSTEENIQARIRGNILMALSNKFGWLVLTTGNKSEVAVGYCTLYGDMTGGFAVIKDVPKTKIYELAGLINSQGREIIPRNVLARAPSAELRPHQTDQDSLPSYDVLDGILKDYVEKHRSLNYIAKKRDKAAVKDVIKKIDLSEYKRRQAPPGIKITPRAFGKDWRLPITNKYKSY